MATPLLRTKLYIPATRSDLVSRPRLIERLNAGLQRRLTLVSAPAGFGKTTLLGEWVTRCSRPTAWISLDRSDNDPVRFWSYVGTALQSIVADVGQATQPMLQSRQLPPMEAVLTVLINDIAERA